MKDQHGIRISYGADPTDHNTYIVYVPLRPGDFPKALHAAVAEAGALLLRSISSDIFPDPPEHVAGR